MRKIILTAIALCFVPMTVSAKTYVYKVKANQELQEQLNTIDTAIKQNTNYIEIIRHNVETQVRNTQFVQTDVIKQLSSMKNEIYKMSEIIKKQQFQIDELRSQQNKPAPEPVKPIDNFTVDKSSPDKFLDGIYNAIIVKGNEYAENLLNEFVAIYPNDKRVSQIYFMLGDLNFKARKYSAASVYFVESFKINPEAEKAGDAILSLGKTLEILQKKEDACNAYSQITSKTVKANMFVMQQADAKYANLGCAIYSTPVLDFENKTTIPVQNNQNSNAIRTVVKPLLVNPQPQLQLQTTAPIMPAAPLVQPIPVQPKSGSNVNTMDIVQPTTQVVKPQVSVQQPINSVQKQVPAQ